MEQALDETNRRRAKQQAYNREHDITPQSIVKSVDMQLAAIVEADYITVPAEEPVIGEITSEEQLVEAIGQLESQMREAAKNFEFERAAALRDRIRSLKQRELGAVFSVPLVTAEGPATDSSRASSLPIPSRTPGPARGTRRPPKG
jgi:excinuclease UvrABC helicase subunit UvrB